MLPEEEDDVLVDLLLILDPFPGLVDLVLVLILLDLLKSLDGCLSLSCFALVNKV